jgi:Mn-dependent DtxR family transcriptional regulator
VPARPAARPDSITCIEARVDTEHEDRTTGVLTGTHVPQLLADLSPSMQRYLLACSGTLRRDGAVTTSGVARAMHIAPPTSLEMLRRLQEAGFITRAATRRGGWLLTVEGQREIAALRRRQSLLERWLRMTLGLEHDEASREAGKLAPSVSPELETRLRDAVWPTAPPCRVPTE